MTPPSLKEIAAHSEIIPSLPEVINHLMRSLKDENADIETLAQHINSDPAIVARLLAAANSAASSLSTRIYSAKQAFLVLGADRVVRIILASALTYRYDVRGSGFDARPLWRHLRRRRRAQSGRSEASSGAHAGCRQANVWRSSFDCLWQDWHKKTAGEPIARPPAVVTVTLSAGQGHWRAAVMSLLSSSMSGTR